jgi:DoxX-like family
MNTVLWIIACVLAFAFLLSGSVKLILPKEKQATFPGGGWTEDFSAGAIKGIGTLEVLAAAGLTLPALFDIVPVLVPVAAVGVALLMVGAMITHLRRRENVLAAATLFYFALAGFVAWARFGPHSFTG